MDGRADPAVSLAKMGLLADGDNGVRNATVAGVLICCHRPEEWLPNACITATRYRGVDRASEQVDAQTICGPLNRQIDEAVAFAVRNMSVAAHKDPGRIDLPQYSKRAIFEALVNAVVHRDYSMRGSRIRLSMFSDRLEIQSPGTLPNSLMVENMASRQATRNEVLASVLGRMPTGETPGAGDRRYFMERRGDGVPVILQGTRGVSGKPAQFRIVGDADLLVVLPSAPTAPSPARVEIGVRASGRPLAGVDVLVLFPNHTWLRSITDEDGYAAVSLHTTELPLTVFAAAADYAAHRERDWTPARRALAIELRDLPDGGAVIFPEGSGRIPGLSGRLNPIRDSLDRTYMYTSNIAINEGEAQPVYITLDEDLRLTDADGAERLARIVDMLAAQPSWSTATGSLRSSRRMAIDYGVLRKTLRNLEAQHRNLMNHSESLPVWLQEAAVESVIQRFKMCYDALWKVLRRHLIYVLGNPQVPNSPRPVFRIAGNSGLLAANGDRWQTYVDARVNTTHRYDEEKALRAVNTIVPQFISDAIDLYTAMAQELWE